MMTAYFPHKTITFLLMTTAFTCITKSIAAENTITENMPLTVLTGEQTIPDEPDFSRPNTPELPYDISLTDETDTQTPIESSAEQPHSVNPEDMVLTRNFETFFIPVQDFSDLASDVRGQKKFNGMRFFNNEEIFARLDFSVKNNQFHADIHNSATGPKISIISRTKATYRVHDDDGAATIALAYILTVQNLLKDMSWFKYWDGTLKAHESIDETERVTATRQDMIGKLKQEKFPVKWHLFRPVANAAFTYRVDYLKRIIKNSNNIDEIQFYQSMIEEIQIMQSGIFTQYQAADQSPSYEEFADSVGQWLQKTLPTCVYATETSHTIMKTFSPVSASVVLVDDAINKLLHYYPYDLNLTETQFPRFQSEDGGFLIKFDPHHYPFMAIPGVVAPVAQIQTEPDSSRTLNALVSVSLPLTSSLGTSAGASPVVSENTDLTTSLDSLSPAQEDSEDYDDDNFSEGYSYGSDAEIENNTKHESYDSETASEDDSESDSDDENYDSDV